MAFKELFKRYKGKDLLDQALDKFERMYAGNKRMFDAAVGALFAGEESEIDIAKADKKLNVYEMEIRKKILSHLSLNPSSDVAYSLLLVGIIRDVERMGDFCKNLMELYEIYGRPLETGHYVRRLIKIEEKLNIMFDLTKNSFEKDDVECAKKVMDMHLDYIAPEMDKMIVEIANEKELKCKKAVVLALCARYFKRISAHLMGIASSVATPFDKIRHREDHPE